MVIILTKFLPLLVLACIAEQNHRRYAVNAFVTTPRRVLFSTSFAKVQQSFPSSFSSTTLYAIKPNEGNNKNNEDTTQNVYVKELNNDSNLLSLLPSPSADESTMLATSGDAIMPDTDEDTVAITDQQDKVWKARSLLIGAAALYGTNFSLVKLLGDTMPEGISLTIRFALAALVTLPWLFEGEIFDTISGEINRDVLMATWLGFEVGLWNSIGYVAQAVGLETTQAGKSAFICSLAVVVVPLLDFITGSKRIETRQWIGAILAVVGVAFLELAGGGGAVGAVQSSSTDMLSTGDMLSLVQPFAFGIGFWKIEKALHQYPTEARRLTAAQLLAVFCASLCYGWSAIDTSALNSYPWSEWMTSPTILFSLFWTGVITTALTIYMENKAMETLSAAEATVIFATEPLWGTAFAAVVMSEQFGVNSAIGAAFIMSACFYSNLGKDGITRVAKEINNSAQQVPVKFQNQWASFLTSVAASWASWDVAVASATDTLPEIQGLNNALEDIVTNILENLPW